MMRQQVDTGIVMMLKHWLSF